VDSNEVLDLISIKESTLLESNLMLGLLATTGTQKLPWPKGSFCVPVLALKPRIYNH